MFNRKRHEPPARTPHPDPAVEARILRIRSRYAAIARTEGRLVDITTEQRALDGKIRVYADDPAQFRALREQADRLRKERNELESSISSAHEGIAAILEELGDEALNLGAFW